MAFYAMHNKMLLGQFYLVSETELSAKTYDKLGAADMVKGTVRVELSYYTAQRPLVEYSMFLWKS